MVHLILVYVCKMWPVKTVNERILAVFDNDSIHRILHVRCEGFVPAVELRHRLRFTGIAPTVATFRASVWMKNPIDQDWLLLKHRTKSAVSGVRITPTT